MLAWKFKINFYYERFKKFDLPHVFSRANLPDYYFKLGVVDYLDNHPDCVGVAIKQDNGYLLIVDEDREMVVNQAIWIQDRLK